MGYTGSDSPSHTLDIAASKPAEWTTALLHPITNDFTDYAMPVEFDEHEPTSGDLDWAVDPGSNAHVILSFLAEHPETGFTPKEIHERTEIPRGSVGTTLRRLEERGLVRHKEPYWAADRRGIEAIEAVLQSLEAVETSTTYDWGEDDSDAYRIGLEAVSEEIDADGT